MKACNILTFKELYEKDYVRRPEGGNITLWHYTNAEGLMGVIRNEKAERANTWLRILRHYDFLYAPTGRKLPMGNRW